MSAWFEPKFHKSSSCYYVRTLCCVCSIVWLFHIVVSSLSWNFVCHRHGRNIPRSCVFQIHFIFLNCCIIFYDLLWQSNFHVFFFCSVQINLNMARVYKTNLTINDHWSIISVLISKSKWNSIRSWHDIDLNDSLTILNRPPIHEDQSTQKPSIKVRSLASK